MDYKPPPEEAVPTFHEGNMGWTLCKEIAIVVTEMVEDFDVKLDLVAAVGVEVQFDPVNATLKIPATDAAARLLLKQWLKPQLLPVLQLK